MCFISSPMLEQFRAQSDCNSASELAGFSPIPRAVPVAHGRAAGAL